MQRVGFQLKVREDLVDEYTRVHQEVWPDMLEALERHGWRNYSLFMSANGTLFGYFEAESSLAESLSGMASEDVNELWQAMMRPFFDGGGTRPDQMLLELEEVFHLD